MSLEDKENNVSSLKRARVKEYSVLFTKQKTQKNKTWHDGILKFYQFNKKVQLVDGESKMVLAEEFIKSENVLAEGSQFCVTFYMIEVSDLINEYERDLSGAFGKSSKQRGDKRQNIIADSSTRNIEGTSSVQRGDRPLKEIVNGPVSVKLLGLQRRKSLTPAQHSKFSTPLKKIPLSFRGALTKTPTSLAKPRGLYRTPVKVEASNISTPQIPAVVNLSDNASTDGASAASISEPTSVKYSLRTPGRPRLYSSRRSSVLPNIGLPTPKSKQRQDNSNHPASSDTPLKPRKRQKVNQQESNSRVSSSSPETEQADTITTSTERKKQPKKKKSTTRVMKLHGPPRPIEIPKKLLEKFEVMVAASKSSENSDYASYSTGISSSNSSSSSHGFNEHNDEASVTGEQQVVKQEKPEQFAIPVSTNRGSASNIENASVPQYQASSPVSPSFPRNTLTKSITSQPNAANSKHSSTTQVATHSNQSINHSSRPLSQDAPKGKKLAPNLVPPTISKKPSQTPSHKIIPPPTTPRRQPKLQLHSQQISQPPDIGLETPANTHPQTESTDSAKQRKRLKSHIEVYASDSSQISENEFSDLDDFNFGPSTTKISTHNHHNGGTPLNQNRDTVNTPNKALTTINDLKNKVDMFSGAMFANGSCSTQTKTYDFPSYSPHQHLHPHNESISANDTGVDPAEASNQGSSDNDQENRFPQGRKDTVKSNRKLGLSLSRRILVESGSLRSNKLSTKEGDL